MKKYNILIFTIGLIITIFASYHWLIFLYRNNLIPLKYFHLNLGSSASHILPFLYAFFVSWIIIISANFYGMTFFSLFNKKYPFYVNIGMGLYLFSLDAFLLGILHILYYPLLVLTIFLPIIINYKKLDTFFYEVKKNVNKRFLYYLTPFLLWFYLCAFLPISQSDGIRYHITIPYLYLSNHKIFYIPLNAFSNFPFTAEMLYLYSLAFNEDVIAKFLHFNVFLLSALMLLKIINSKNEKLNFIIFCSYLTIPFFPILASWSFIDFFIGFFLSLNIFFLKKFFEKNKFEYLLLAFTFLGITFSCKYSILLIILIESILLLFFHFNYFLTLIKDKNKIILLFFVLSFPIFPYMLKNFIYTRNPVYPLANNIFKGGEWKKDDVRFYISKTREKGVKKTLKNFIKTPFYMVSRWQNFGGWNIGLSFIILFLSIFAYYKNRFLNFMRLMALLYFISWFFTYQSNRFAIPLIIFLFILFFSVYDIKKYMAIICLFIFFNSLECFTTTLKPSFYPLSYFSGYISKDEFLLRRLSYYPLSIYFRKNKWLEDKKILFLGEYRRYYLPPKNLYVADWFDPPYILYFIRKYHLNTAKELLKLLRKKNINYIFYNQKELFTANNYKYFKKRFSNKEWKIYKNFMKLLKNNKKIYIFSKKLILIKLE